MSRQERPKPISRLGYCARVIVLFKCCYRGESVSTGWPPSTEKTPNLHYSVRPLSYRLVTDMRRAFVLRLTPEARPGEGTFQGRVEEVGSGRNVKFGTIEEFLDFLQQCLDHQETADK